LIDYGRSIILKDFEYLIVYKRDGDTNTWTLPEGSFQINYRMMKSDPECEIVNVYRRLNSKEILDVSDM
jgi:hypothetical protein